MLWQLTSLTMLLAALLIQPAATGATQVQPNCSLGQTPTLSYRFAELHGQLGTIVGDPIECEHVDAVSGDTYQQTTTGIALYHKNANMALFTNGREQWAITADGLVHWSGWHATAGPLGTAPPPDDEREQMATASIGSYPRVEAVTMVQALDDDGQRVVVRRAGSSYVVETAGRCSDGQPLDGRTAFIVSPAAFAGPNSWLILTLGGRECTIAASYPL
jgi:hypothetical protein